MTDYIFQPGNSELAPILLLHSTGGDEMQLLPVAEMIAAGHPILSIRGRISDGGINRFFKLKGAGGFSKENFDLDSLAEEADWLAAELEVLAAKHGLDASKFIVIGYSNGANIALHMTLTGRCHFDKIIAYHAMSLTEIENPVSSASQIFLTFSGNDPIVSNENFAELLENLEATGVKPVVYQTSYGHQLTQNEIEASKNWLDEKM